MKTNKFLAATSLVLTVAAFGCSTNRSVTPGSSSGTQGNPPMASSYTDAVVDAAAQQGYQHQAKVLGVVNPGGVQIGVPVQPTGGAVVPPAMLVNPQSTINRSVSSPNGDQAITGGVGGGGGGGVVFAGAATVSGGSVSTGSAGASTASASPLAVTGALGVGATPAAGTVIPATTATTPVVSGNTARVSNGIVTAVTPIGTTTAATMAVTNSINVGATPASGTVVPSATATSPSISGTSIFAPAAKAAKTSSSTRSIAVKSGLRISQGVNGEVVVSNVKTTVPSTKASPTTTTDKSSTSATPSVKP